MDPLSDLLRAVRLNGTFFYTFQAAQPWSVSARPSEELVPLILPSSDHLMAYHILTEGSCFGGIVGEQPIEMGPGDVIVFPHGHPHLMSSHGARTPVHRHQTVPIKYPHSSQLGDGPMDTRFVCGFFGVDAKPFNPLIASLPPVLHVRGIASGWLAAFANEVTREATAGRAGADTMLTRMAEMMFIEVLRHHVESLGPDQTGWLAGLRDPIVSAALSRLHQQPARNWTLAELATEVATSRSVLAERFTRVVGVPPMQYLAQWRLQLAADLLARGGAKVSAVGLQVGYESEAAFSRAFKRATGEAPATWRRRRAG